MRKLFRFKYEPCNKTCYAYCSKLMTELRKLPDGYRRSLVNLMVKSHDRLCDNPDYSFGVDMDEDNGVFVAHFRTPSSTDLYSSKQFDEVVKQVCGAVMNASIPKIDGNCTFGSNGAEDLGKEILKFCEDVAFAELENAHCECKARRPAAPISR